MGRYRPRRGPRRTTTPRTVPRPRIVQPKERKPQALLIILPHPYRVDMRDAHRLVEWLTEGSWMRTESSNVQAVRYMAQHAQLQVQFDGWMYTYYQVTADTARDMLCASSKGAFVWQRLRDRYAFTKVRGNMAVSDAEQQDRTILPPDSTALPPTGYTTGLLNYAVSSILQVIRSTIVG